MNSNNEDNSSAHGDIFDSIVKNVINKHFEMIEEQQRKQRLEWEEFISTLSTYSIERRKAIIFLPDSSVEKIWYSISPNEAEIVYVPISSTIPGLSFYGQVSKGNLYVIDPRDNKLYYKANDIGTVLIKDHLLEIKEVFERLGALKIDISFCGLVEQKNDMISHNNQELNVDILLHSLRCSHEGEQSSRDKASLYNQLEIHKTCAGIRTNVNLNDYYWIKNDQVFVSEVESVLQGLTKEVHIKEYVKSYFSQIDAEMNKIHAEYSKMQSIGVSAMCEWSESKMSELTKSSIWDVHIIINDKNNKPIEYNKQRLSSKYSSQLSISLKNEESEYMDLLRDVLEEGEISMGERKLLEKLRVKLGISKDRAKELEDSLSQPLLSDEEIEYLNEYRDIIAKGDITPGERKLLDRICNMNGISAERAKELEALA